MNNYQILRKVAEDLVTKAGVYLLKTQKETTVITYKDRQDVCTTADLGAEKIIIEGIKAIYPKHQIQSEEAGLSNDDSTFRWIIDPLDGTKEFIRDIPQYNSAIAVEHNGILVASAIYRPSDNTLYSASLGDGAYKNGVEIHVSTQSDLKDSFFYCYLPAFARDPARYQTAWEELGLIGQNIYRLRSFADENTALCWLAQGAHEGYLNLSNTPKWHDIAPGILIAKEAGAYIDQAQVQALRVGENTPLVVTNCESTYNALSLIISS